jgi:hypothetical protein
MDSVDLLQWLGFAGIVGGYLLYGRNRLTGSSVSAIGSVPLAVWAFIMSAWGVFTLQVVCIAINLINVRKAMHDAPNPTSSPMCPGS